MIDGNIRMSGSEVPPPPDLRQSICHTLMASGFVLLVIQNPFSVGTLEGTFHTWIMLALLFVVMLSWYFFSRRLRTWKKVPSSVRARATRRPRDLRQRAISHLLMSLLALTLTALGYLASLAVPSSQNETIASYIVVGMSGLVGVLSVATFTRTIRDLLSARHLTG